MSARPDNAGAVLVACFPCVVLDAQNMEAARHGLNELIDDRWSCKLLLSFRKVKFVSSGALGQLINLHKTLSEAGGQLVLCHLDPEVHEVFQCTKLDRVFRIEDDPEAEHGGVEIPLHGADGE